MKTLTLFALLLTQQITNASLFKANNFYPQYSSAKSTAVGDINNDGYNDVVIALQQKGRIEIYYNDKNNGFVAKPFDISRSIDQLDLADFNRDGKLDLLVLSTEGQASLQIAGRSLPSGFNTSLQVFVNEGTPEYNMSTPFFSFNTNAKGEAFRAGDFDQDGFSDIIFTTSSASQFSTSWVNDTYYYSGKEDFSFETINLDFHLQKGSMLADYNQDGYLDIWNLHDSPKVYLYDPAAGFTRDNQQLLSFELFTPPPPPNVLNPTTPSYSRVLLADLDNDGDTDVFALGGNGEFLRFLKTENQFILSNPDFELPLPFTSFYEGHYSTQYGGLIDVNNDGLLDVLVGTNESENLLVVEGLGENTEVKVLSASNINRFGGEMIVEDFNADGFTDALVIGANGLILWENNQQGQFNKHVNQDFRWGIKRHIKTGLMNQDNHTDVVLAGRNGIIVKHGNGLGAFTASQQISHQEIQQLLIADLNQDGLNDLVGVFEKQVFKWQQETDGSYKQQEIFSETAKVYQIKAHDYDQDGDIDLSFVYEDKLMMLKNNEQGFEFNQPLDAVVLDHIWVKGSSNKHELLVFTDRMFGQYDTGIMVFEYNQSEAFQVTQAINVNDIGASVQFPFLSSEDGMQLFDMDLDGTLDVIVPYLDVLNQDLIWMKKSNDGWQNKSLGVVGSSFRFANEFADLNQDGFLDVFVSINSIGSTLGSSISRNDYIWMGSENGFTEDETLALNLGTSESQLADLDADGDLDLIQTTVGSGFATQLNTTVDLDFSGLWFNPDENGHGLQLEQIDFNGKPAVNFSWFAFHNGKPFWLVGLAPIVGNHAEIPVHYTDGTGFGLDFISTEVNMKPWGTVNLTLNNYNQIDVSWETNIQGFVSDSMTMQRLSVIKPVSNDDSRISSCHSGSWYNANESGHGFFINVIEQGGQEKMLLAWYHYLNGEQSWLIAQGPLFGSKAYLTAQNGTGGEFSPAFDGSSVEISDWGYLDFNLVSDAKATIQWVGINEAFPAGRLELEKLTLIDRYQCFP